MNESKIRKIVKKYLVSENKKIKNVEIDAEFESLNDPRGYVFLYFGSGGLYVSPQVYVKKNGKSKDFKRATNFYELCYYSPNWDDSANPETKVFKELSIFEYVEGIYKATDLPDGGFDLNSLAVAKATELMRIGSQLQKGKDPFGIKTSGVSGTSATVMNPVLAPPNSSELTKYQKEIITKPWVMEAMRVEEIANGIFDGIRKKESGSKEFLKYLDANKSEIKIGKDLAKTYEASLEKGLKDPIDASQQNREKDSINSMYEYLAGMKEFSSSDRQLLLAERDSVLNANKMQLEKIKSEHPMFSKGFLILMQKKIKKGENISYNDMINLSNDFKNSASVVNLMPNISGLFTLFNNLKNSPDVSEKDKIKIAAIGGKEIVYNQFITDIFNSSDSLLSTGGNKSDYKFNNARLEEAMSEFSKMLKDSDNTLTQPIVVQLKIAKTGMAPKINLVKIDNRVGGNIKLGLRRWVNRKLIPAIDSISTSSRPHKAYIFFPAARYIGKGLS